MDVVLIYKWILLKLSSDSSSWTLLASIDWFVTEHGRFVLNHFIGWRLITVHVITITITSTITTSTTTTAVVLVLVDVGRSGSSSCGGNDWCGGPKNQRGTINTIPLPSFRGGRPDINPTIIEQITEMTPTRTTLRDGYDWWWLVVIPHTKQKKQKRERERTRTAHKKGSQREKERKRDRETEGDCISSSLLPYPDFPSIERGRDRICSFDFDICVNRGGKGGPSGAGIKFGRTRK